MADETAAEQPSKDQHDPNEPIDAELVPLDSAPTPTPVTASPVPTPVIDPGYTPDGVPTFESVREKIENRYGTAIGSAQDAMMLYMSIRAARTFVIEYQRGGEARTLEVDVV